MIIRKTNPKGGVSALDLAHRLGGYAGLNVLDTKPSSLLIEGDAKIVEKVSRGIEGWTAFPFAKISVPDTRPRILRPPSKSNQ
jgi:hypothetical protein